jgi:hypothetical protein
VLQGEPSSFNLVRVPVNPSTGRLDPDDGSGGAPPGWIAPPNILPAMRRSKQLEKRANACLGTKPPRKQGKVENCEFNPAQGANIEGIAVFGDTVFVGFRGPVDATPPTCWRSTARACSGRSLAAT